MANAVTEARTKTAPTMRPRNVNVVRLPGPADTPLRAFPSFYRPLACQIDPGD